ncbi:protein kinase MEC1 [Aspergillus nidulans FGSC A4]|uniref:Serine/threonine-protein kinase MEC1 n=2 Tax=Emericella nidulans TaxID=162425 RepID=C8VB89_EMENI|nr:protein kinase MEC1 [Aspergillus nidulans FGSC A4]AAD53316.1 UVSB [Aspergillus nidulans]CBF79340.1 TPA: UVSB [Source:UniProtKB/TrEMBL;Acc:Q9UV56] [Aspergillus nidulans FGSC A4]
MGMSDWASVEPVSSTLAAQLAPRLSSQGSQIHHLTKEAFAQLRQELLEGKFSHLSLDDSATDVSRLVCIVLKAGLEPCMNDEKPDEADLNGQLLDCLDIIKTAVSKAPHTLTKVPDPEILGEKACAPLYVWLAVRLLHLSSVRCNEIVKEKITGIFSIIVCAQYKHTRLWSTCHVIPTFLRACVTEVILILERLCACGRWDASQFKLSFPLPGGPLSVGLGRISLPRNLFRKGFKIGSTERAFNLILALLESFVVPESSPTSVPDKASIVRQNLAWILNGYERLWNVLSSWLRSPSLDNLKSKVELCSHFLTSIRPYCFYGSSFATEIAYDVPRMLGDILSLNYLDHYPSLQLNTSQFIDDLCLPDNCTEGRVKCLRGLLSPLSDTLKKATFESLEPHLQAAVRNAFTKAMRVVSTVESATLLTNHAVGTMPDSLSCSQGLLAINQEVEGDEFMRASKRYCRPQPRNGQDGSNTTQQLISKSLKILRFEGSPDLQTLKLAVIKSFPTISDQNKCEVLDNLSRLPCAFGGSSTTTVQGDLLRKQLCRMCDEECQDSDLFKGQTDESDELCLILTFVVPKISRSSNIRVITMATMKRILMHTLSSTHLQLSNSIFGDFILNSLRSSLRELRVLAGQSIVCFVRHCLDHETRRRNFVVILNWLKNLTEEQETALHETCIMSLCRLARFSNDEEMNIILLRLVEYLGHPNPFLCGVAYTEISKLAQHLVMSPAGLFRPFWRTLSVTVVKNLQSRPYMAEQLCDLLGMTVDDFLRLTEVYVLPHLVLWRKREVIARIGCTYKDAKTPFDICSEKDNLAAILAFLLCQPSSEPQKMIMSTLSAVDPAFNGRTLAELVRIEPILIACDLLKGLGDSEDEKGAKFQQALRILASLVPRKSAYASKKSNLVGHFIEEHVLGIITQFAHAINDFQIRQPLVEKKRNIMAIGAMIKVAPGHVSSALPQICACLRSALEIKELCNNAFRVWGVLVSSLHKEEVEPLLDQTLAIVIKHWVTFTEDTRKFAYELVEHILESHQELLRDIFGIMPSLASIPVLSRFEASINELKGTLDVRSHFMAFARRCLSENATVVEQALTELVSYLERHEEFVHRSVLSEQPDPAVAHLVRSLLDCCVKFNITSESITLLCARCLGHIGCLDPNRVDTIKEKKGILVLSNFDKMEETFDFVLFFFQHVLVDAFLSASNTRAQGFLAYAMQNLLMFCNLNSAVTQRSRGVQADEKYQRWLELPETVRNTLTPFLTSRYTVTIKAASSNCTFPLFAPGMSHADWLRAFVQGLLQTGNGDNAKTVFSICSRIIKGQDISIASFLFPFAVLHRVVGGTEKEKDELQGELMNILAHPLPENKNDVHEAVLLCSQSVFEVLDYLSRWVQGKKKQLNNLKNRGYHRASKENERDLLVESYTAQVKAVECLLSSIPPEVISKRAVECKSFSRALFHWEQYIRQYKTRPKTQQYTSLESLYEHLQGIYSQIDEPDGIEGISTHLHVLNIDQQVLEHRKAGRWATAQSWYELQLEREPDNLDAQWNLFTCLKESGQQDAILTRFEILQNTSSVPRFLPFAVEASWMTGKWEKMHNYLELCPQQATADFNIGIGLALDAFRRGEPQQFREIVDKLRLSVARSLTANSVTSLQSCHDSMLKLHALTEIESVVLAGGADGSQGSRSCLRDALDRRLDVLGGYISDKQYLLGLRRAAMELAGSFADSDIAAAWLTSARLLRRGNFGNQAYQSMLNAAHLKDRSATIEHARLLWKDGHHRKAIQILEGAIAANEFAAPALSSNNPNRQYGFSNHEKQQNLLAARAHLLLAKWTDRAGQTQSDIIVQRYREAIKLHNRWEKAHYYLGKHYNKILDSEKSKPLGKEAQIYLSGEASKLVVDNYLRSLAHGNKYVFQSLPKVLTLWLEHASTVEQPLDPKRGDNTDFQAHTLNQRRKSLDDMHSQLRKYVNRMPVALLFTILPQVVARICHPNPTVYNLLTKIVAKVVNAFPQQGLWTVLAVAKSSSADRASRGLTCLDKITDISKRLKTESTTDIRGMINQGQKFSDELLKLCVAKIENKTSRINLARNLNFNHKVAPCRLVVPFQTMLTPTLPASHDAEYLKGFRAFPRDPTTIEAVLDDAQILNSLQKPRKISIRGSDGRIYNILCKPKDDLRKDQRLMEFNNMINRFLKKDVESSKRRMYIKTYAVTPLNEECGLIEWVDNLRTLRDLVTRALKERGITPNYDEIRHYLNEACSDPSKVSIFTDKVLATFPPVLHEWFVEMFPETGAWFAARLRYTRSCAVMSMVGYVLGLGDRHGENILFEEGTGGILHVDFNCLFDKGLTFDKPELVPFRLTQNMIDAFGAYGYNGPFRKTCELSLDLLRQNEDALMTILETFLHDPTTDFIGKKRRTHANVPDTPAGVLENVRNKLRGLLPGESVPLSVDGHVDELIIQATDERNLAAMYIGWCAFF